MSANSRRAAAIDPKLAGPMHMTRRPSSACVALPVTYLPDGLLLTAPDSSRIRASMPENIISPRCCFRSHPPACVEAHKDIHWPTSSPPLSTARRLVSCLVEIVFILALSAKALNMPSSFTKRNGVEDRERDESYPTERTHAVLAQSDYVLLLLPATLPPTKTLSERLDEKALSQKKTAWLAECRRGQLDKDSDLSAAVTEKKSPARCWTCSKEPLAVGPSFWKTQGIMVLPHIGCRHPYARFHRPR